MDGSFRGEGDLSARDRVRTVAPPPAIADRAGPAPPRRLPSVEPQRRGIGRRTGAALLDDVGTVALPDGPSEPDWWQAIQWFRDPVGYVERGAAAHGSIFRARLGPTGKVAVIGDPAAIRQVLDARPEEVRMGDANGLFRPVVGSSSLLLLDGNEHLRHRRILLPMFRGAAFQRFLELIREIADREISALPERGELPLRRLFDQIAVAVIFEVMLGPADSRRPALIAAFRAVMALSGSPFTLTPQFRKSLGGLSPYGRLMRRLAALDRLFLIEIESRRLDPALADRCDVLSGLIAATDSHGVGLADRELRDQLMTLLMAGHETSAAGLSWAVERLRCNQHCLEPLLASVDGADKLAYLEAFIRESLRQRPVVGVMVRKLLVTAHLGPYSLPPGWIAMNSIVLAHRDPGEYPEPERFRPERFLPPVKEMPLWIPFGGGIRRCIGMALAELEMRVVLRALLSRYLIEPDDRLAAKIGRERFILVPGDHARCQISRR